MQSAYSFQIMGMQKKKPAYVEGLFCMCSQCSLRDYVQHAYCIRRLTPSDSHSTKRITLSVTVS